MTALLLVPLVVVVVMVLRARRRRKGVAGFVLPVVMARDTGVYPRRSVRRSERDAGMP